MVVFLDSYFDLSAITILTISHIISSFTASNTTPYIPKNVQALTASIGNGLKLAAKTFTPAPAPQDAPVAINIFPRLTCSVILFKISFKYMHCMASTASSAATVANAAPEEL